MPQQNQAHPRRLPQRHARSLRRRKPTRPSSFTRRPSAQRSSCACPAPAARSCTPRSRSATRSSSSATSSRRCPIPAARRRNLKGTSAAIYLYVNDVDATFAQAVKSGGKVNMPLTDMFWGDRYGQIQDPFGHIWALATHKEDSHAGADEAAPREAVRRRKVSRDYFV